MREWAKQGIKWLQLCMSGCLCVRTLMCVSVCVANEARNAHSATHSHLQLATQFSWVGLTMKRAWLLSVKQLHLQLQLQLSKT